MPRKKARAHQAKARPASKPAPPKPSQPKPKPAPASAEAQKSTATTTTTPSTKPLQKNQQPTIPFDPNDAILLVGEGDFSFAASIVAEHGCANVLATSFDSRADLDAKYPQATQHIAYLESEEQRVRCGVDATKLGQVKEIRAERWERVVFNFPHTGGKSTDVNRQVRYNQELLVSFFTAATPLLAPAGTIIVTLFEGEPYTLWNIRDLARHVGLKVQQSFKFQADAYPGYHHARTLGNIEGGGGWKGETRAARTYVFEASGDGAGEGRGERGGKRGKDGKKRKRGGDESSDDD